MNEKTNRNLVITIIILSVILTISVGLNIGLGRSVPDNQRLRDQQRELERAVEQLTLERDRERETVGELRNLNREARGIINGVIETVETNGASLSNANKILRSVITALQSLDLLYRGDNRGGDNGLDTLGG